VLRLLERLHVDQGRPPWADLLAPTIALAEAGFPVSPRPRRRHRRSEGVRARRAAGGGELFFPPDGAVLPAGAILAELEFAATLRLIAEEGAAPFHADKRREGVALGL
jgi:gamma-glutamyltranspeptidase/glutathione hydrolase